MFESVASLFEGYGALAMLIFALGVIFCIVEIFIPGFGIFGIMGSVLIATGVIVRFLLDFDVQHLILMMGFVIVVVFGAAVIMISSAKHGMLGRSPLIENRTSIPVGTNYDNKEYLKILGKVAFADTKFTPAGKFSLNNQTYEAISYGEFIEKGTKIQVVEVAGNTIYIKKASQ